MKISRTSWHYKLAKLGTEYSPAAAADLCTYVRLIFAGLFKLVFLGSLAIVCGGVLLWSVGDFIAWILVCISFWTLLEPEAGIVVMGTAAFCVLLGAVVGVQKIVPMAASGISNASPPFVADAYRAFKDKVCVLLTFD